MNRGEILDAARDCVERDRAATHGQAEDSFQRIADLWAAYSRQPFTAHDVAMMLALMKVARIAGNPRHEDNYVDLAGYGVLAGEIATGRLF